VSAAEFFAHPYCARPAPGTAPCVIVTDGQIETPGVDSWRSHCDRRFWTVCLFIKNHRFGWDDAITGEAVMDDFGDLVLTGAMQ
jgi:hypothetical protein